jgi:hypothetical protein
MLGNSALTKWEKGTVCEQSIEGCCMLFFFFGFIFEHFLKATLADSFTNIIDTSE